jgi:hypothetical protein
MKHFVVYWQVYFPKQLVNLNRISGALHGTDKDISATWMKTA